MAQNEAALARSHLPQKTRVVSQRGIQQEKTLLNPKKQALSLKDGSLNKDFLSFLHSLVHSKLCSSTHSVTGTRYIMS